MSKSMQNTIYVSNYILFFIKVSTFGWGLKIANGLICSQILSLFYSFLKSINSIHQKLGGGYGNKKDCEI